MEPSVSTVKQRDNKMNYIEASRGLKNTQLCIFLNPQLPMPPTVQHAVGPHKNNWNLLTIPLQ